MCSVGDILCVGLLADYLLITLHGVVVWKKETIVNAMYFIINSNITPLRSRNRSAVLTYMHVQVAVYMEREDGRYTHPYLPFISRAQIHIDLVVCLFLAPTSRTASITYTDKFWLYTSPTILHSQI